ncbi:MAG: DM13 domain-containing protein [Synechococcales cyanobacterium C42_A2020_086]|jgi:hypothetical protein|nr:DM13 domain-containing protein [Synechococcales cyanobacterium C42_A2020_086]
MKHLVASSFVILLLTTGCAVRSPRSGPSPSSVETQTPTQELSQGFQVVASGSFVSGEHPTQGSVRILEENGQRYIELGNDFQTNRGPDLFVILHRSPDVIGTTVAPTHSINEGEYVTIAPLESVNGQQRYPIPIEVNLADYQSVAIWCRQFNATFGAASLQS